MGNKQISRKEPSKYRVSGVLRIYFLYCMWSVLPFEGGRYNQKEEIVKMGMVGKHEISQTSRKGRRVTAFCN